MLSDLAARFEKAGYIDLQFLVVNAGHESALAQKAILTSAAEPIAVYQETSEEPVWEKMAARKDDIMVFDRCGRLSFHILLPFSKLDFPYTKAAILSTYKTDPCGLCTTEAPESLTRATTTTMITTGEEVTSELEESTLPSTVLKETTEPSLTVTTESSPSLITTGNFTLTTMTDTENETTISISTSYFPSNATVAILNWEEDTETSVTPERNTTETPTHVATTLESSTQNIASADSNATLPSTASAVNMTLNLTQPPPPYFYNKTDNNDSAMGNLSNVSAMGNLTNVSAMGNLPNVSAMGNLTNVSAMGNLTNVSAMENLTNVSAMENLTNVSAMGNLTNVLPSDALILLNRTTPSVEGQLTTKPSLSLLWVTRRRPILQLPISGNRHSIANNKFGGTINESQPTDGTVSTTTTAATPFVPLYVIMRQPHYHRHRDHAHYHEHVVYRIGDKDYHGHLDAEGTRINLKPNDNDRDIDDTPGREDHVHKRGRVVYQDNDEEDQIEKSVDLSRNLIVKQEKRPKQNTNEFESPSSEKQTSVESAKQWHHRKHHQHGHNHKHGHSPKNEISREKSSGEDSPKEKSNNERQKTGAESKEDKYIEHYSKLIDFIEYDI